MNKLDFNTETTVTVRRSTLVVGAILGIVLVSSMRRNAYVDGYLSAVETVVQAADKAV